MLIPAVSSAAPAKPCREEAGFWFAKALAIADEHKMPVGGQILIDLAPVMKDTGEAQFTAALRQAFSD